MKSKPIDIRRRLSTSKDDLRDLSYLIAISPDMRLLWFNVMVIALIIEEQPFYSAYQIYVLLQLITRIIVTNPQKV